MLFPISQARIKSLVFNMLKQQYETMTGGSKQMLWYPECATVQHLLPCFVSTYLNVNNDPSASRTATKNCKLLVHELLLSYELNPFEQRFSKKWKEPFLNERRQTLAQDVIGSMTKLLQCINNIFYSTTILPKVVAGFESLIKVIQPSAKSVSRDDKLCPWTVQLFMLTKRLLSCVQTIGLYSEPLYKSLDQVWSGCSFDTDEELVKLYKICR